jgi:hypothetical protein
MGMVPKPRFWGGRALFRLPALPRGSRGIRHKMPHRHPSKQAGWSREESRIVAALETQTHIENVTFDEAGVDSPVNLEPSSHWCSRKRFFLAAAFSILIIAVAASLAVILPDKSTQNDTTINITQFKEDIPPYSLQVAERDSSSPQAKALQFISTTRLGAYNASRLLQRYALAVLYYSMFYGDRPNQEDECQWFERVDFSDDVQPAWDGNSTVCNDAKQCLFLVAVGGRGNGTIPGEVEMLTALRYLRLRARATVGTVPPQL